MAAPRQPELRRLVARWLRRLATAVAPTDRPAERQPSPEDGGPPEHWLAAVRSRAPELLHGRGIGTRNTPTAGPPLAPSAPPSPGVSAPDRRVRRSSHMSWPSEHTTTPPEPAWPHAGRNRAAMPRWPAGSSTEQPAPPVWPTEPQRPTSHAGDFYGSRPVSAAMRRLGSLLRWPVERLRRGRALASTSTEPPAHENRQPVSPRPPADHVDRAGQAEPPAARRHDNQPLPPPPRSPVRAERHIQWPPTLPSDGARMRHIPTDSVQTPHAATGTANTRVTSGEHTYNERRTHRVERDERADRARRVEWAERVERAERGERAEELDVAAEPDRWPQLPDDAALWTPPRPAFAADHVRRIDNEQRGW